MKKKQENKETNGIPFKQFLDESSNLITIFGVFNALFIYSSQIDKDISQFLLPTFLFLSLFIWYELILFAINSNNGTFKYELFYILTTTIQIGLIWFFVISFKLLLLYLLIPTIYFILIFIVSFILYYISKRLLKKRKKITSFIIVFLSIFISAGLLITTMNYIKPYIEKSEFIKELKKEKSNDKS